MAMGGANQPFIGTVQGTLDAKGRVCIPANYRQILAAQNTTGCYVCPSFVEAALEAFGEDVLQSFHQRLSQLDPFFSAAHDDQAFAVLSSSQHLVLDEQGRVRLPDAVIAHAGLKDRVTFVGMGAKFQIWEPSAFEAKRSTWIANARGLRVNASGGAVG
jgi:MraZ protein